MIDLHCHILPGIDDGAVDEAESLIMMKAAVAEGIKTIVATPHHQNGRFVNERENVLAKVSILRELVKEHNLDLEILPGQEIRLYGEIVNDHHVQKIVPVGGNTRYVLIEFPSNHIPRYAERLFYDIQLQGLKPIIVHPERNQELFNEPKKLSQFIEKGALVQVTASSFTGRFGKKIQKFSQQLVEANAVHIIASDAHNVSGRGFQMKEAFELLEKKYGSDQVAYFHKNAQDILADKLIYPQPVDAIKRKKIFGIF